MTKDGLTIGGVVQERTLANGLVALVCEDRRAPVAAVVTHVRAGYFDEPDATAGISHVLEHMFFKGTLRRRPGDIARETKQLGGHLNAGTIYDRTSYYTVLPATAVASAIDVQADALCNSIIEAGELERELNVIIQESKRKLDSPAAVARETLYETMFDVHRIRRWRIGTESTLSGLTRDDVLAFYKSHYRASNVILSVVGDIDAAHVFDLIERHYGSMPGESPARDHGPEEPAHAGFRFRDMQGEIAQSRIELGWRSPGELHADTPLLDVLAVVIGQGRGSRLYREVRETGLVTEIGSSNYTPGDIGIFGISAVTRPDDVNRALDAVADVIEAMRQEAPGPGEMERARNILEARMIRRFETVEGQASSLAEWQALGGWRLLEAYQDRMLKASADELADVAERHLDPRNATALVYRPSWSAAVEWQPDGSRGPRRHREPPLRDLPALRRAEPPAGHVEGGIHFHGQGARPIIIVPRREIPLVSIALCFAGGVTEEEESTAGSTVLMARASVKGTKDRTAARLANDAESLGGSIVPGVAADAFEWSIHLPAKHLHRGLELLCDAALSATFPRKELEMERDASLSEIELLRDDMYGYPRRLFWEAAFEGHPYGHTLSAIEGMLRRVDPSDIRSWHGRVVRDRSPAVFICGDVDAAEAAAVACGQVGFRDGVRPEAAADAQWPAERKQRVVERRTAQTALVLGFPGPKRNDPDADALRVLAAAVAGLGGSLFEELRSRRSLAYTVSAEPVLRSGGGAFIAYIATSPEREDEARAGLIEELLKLRQEKIAESDVDRARRYLIGRRQIRLQTNGARLAEVSRAVLLGRGVRDLEEYESRILAVTAEEIRETARRWFDESRLVEGVVRGSGGAR